MNPPPEDSADRREVLILANPFAGSRRRGRPVRELVDALGARGLHGTPCWDRDQFSDLARSRSDALRCVVAAGGDGTLAEVLNRAPQAPVAVFPVGTVNLMARYFGLGRSASRLAEGIASFAVRRLDLARADNRLFSLMVSAGFDAHVVHDLHRFRRGNISLLSYVLPGLRALRTYPFPLIEVEIEDTCERLRGAAVFLFNLPVYGPGLPIAAGARPDDGLLDLFVFQRPGLVNLARYVLATLSGGHRRLPDVQHRRVRRALLWSGQPAPVQTDGDPSGMLPVTVEVAPAALRLLLPR
jgi:diacylglycerol kinase family enzyme